MPTNQEWLNQLATESPDKLKAWFDAEHNDDLAAKNGISGDTAHSNDGKADKREQLEADVRKQLCDMFGNSQLYESVIEPCIDRAMAMRERDVRNEQKEELEELREAFDEICKCAHVPTDWKPIFAAGAVTGTIEGAQKLVSELQEQVDRLTAERDNLAADLEEFMESIDALRDRFRIASSAALDNAHEIQRIIDQFWND